MTIDEWTADGARITDSEVMRRLRRVLEDESPLIVEHRFYRGARAPHRFVCDDPDDFEEYLRGHAHAGDSFYLWHFEDCCRDDNTFATGKVPDSQGRVPKGGVY